MRCIAWMTIGKAEHAPALYRRSKRFEIFLSWTQLGGANAIGFMSSWHTVSGIHALKMPGNYRRSMIIRYALLQFQFDGLCGIPAVNFRLNPSIHFGCYIVSGSLP